MAINYGPQGPDGDRVSFRAEVDNNNLAPGSRTDLRITANRVEGVDTVVNVGVVLWNDPGGVATVEPPGTVVGPFCIAVKLGIPLPTNVDTDLHFLIDNPATGLNPAGYSLILVVWWTTQGPFVLGPTPHPAL